ncbi:outer membrane beta-barrel protein [Sabulibacter ruber]|uniref:outer membrane beta-barrel protein n=1 Tax=Sabulibacter ruber TaxID=2811901 RepID=UPI001A96902A|nr:outer membrane beta-barrel protein [Sabulibacter ruber]
MKKLLLSLLLMLGCHFLQAQDLVVTYEGDSLNCKITREAKDRLYFTFMYKGAAKNTVLSKHLIRQYQRNYFTDGEIPETSEYQYSEQAFSRYRLGVSGGWSYRIARTADGLQPFYKEYIDNLKQGFHINGDAAYYFNEQMGAGLRYSTYHAANELDNVTATMPDGTTVTGTLSDKINITYVGPYFSSRTLNRNKLNAWIFNVGFGYLGYTDKALQVNERYTFKGSTFGLSADAGYDMRISKKLSVGLQISFVTGTLRQMEVSNGTTTQKIKLQPENYENLSRLDVSVGLRFNH